MLICSPSPRTVTASGPTSTSIWSLPEQEDGSVEYRTQSRGGKGRRDIKTTARNGKVVCVKAVIDNEDIVFVTRSGMIVRTQSEEIRRSGATRRASVW